MARSGRRTIKIDAPLMMIQNKAVWMDEAWVKDFFSWMEKNKFKITGLKHMHNKLKLTFVDAKECTMFGLKYASRKK
jgi:hypothetical protein